MLRKEGSLECERVCNIKCCYDKMNVIRFCLQFLRSTELDLMSFGHFGFKVRYIKMREKNYCTKDLMYQQDKLRKIPRLHVC